jgi:hypothetical protein
MAGIRSPRLSWLPWFALAIAAGIWLRLDQLASQLLLEDEWHAVYRVVHDSPSAIFLDFGHSDHSIPLTLLYGLEALAFGLSEIAMRWPQLAAGIATLMLFPCTLRGASAAPKRWSSRRCSRFLRCSTSSAERRDRMR